jgi:hypothetical protein
MKLFNLNNWTLLVALALSTVAEFYSIIGLATIFAGAAVAVMVMGAMLGVAKITTTVWLRKYWHVTSLALKCYLVPAVVILALITSMGIFGYLSKAHSTSSLPSGDITSKISLIDERILTERDNIKVAREALAQMDSQVNNINNKGDSERSAERSVQVRRQQAGERTKLQKEIGASNNKIAKLNEERAPIASELRNFEAEVGPIKYIAALIYGDNPDQSVLEKSVVWMIILLIIVFDPLAIALVLAANHAKEYEANKEESKDAHIPVNAPAVVEEVVTETVIVETPVEAAPVHVHKATEQATKTHEYTFVEEESFPDYPDEEIVVWEGIDHSRLSSDSDEEIETVEVATELAPVVPYMTVSEGVADEAPSTLEHFDTTERPGDYVTKQDDLESDTLELYQDLGSNYVQYEGKRMHKRVLAAMHPEFKISVDDDVPQPGFGTSFPKIAVNGQIFTRVDTLPNRVFKFTAKKWIEVDRTKTDSYLTQDYVSHLVDKVGSGEYDEEFLTSTEVDAIENLLSDSK